MKHLLPTLLGAALLVLLLATASRSVAVVAETQYVLVTEFGRPVAVYGDDAGESGLHLKWPWQTAEPIDRRLQVFDPPSREMITGDKKNLEVSSYVVWRVGDPSRFIRSAGVLDVAE